MTSSSSTLPINGPRPDVVTPARHYAAPSPPASLHAAEARLHPDALPPRARDEQDRVELSDAARRHADRPDRRPRPDVVERVRSEIRADAYLTEEKIDVAVERLYLDLFG
jgi:hypothetical protein